MRKLFRDYLFNRGDQLDEYYDWLIVKLGKEVNKDDYYDAKEEVVDSKQRFTLKHKELVQSLEDQAEPESKEEV